MYIQVTNKLFSCYLKKVLTVLHHHPFLHQRVQVDHQHLSMEYQQMYDLLHFLHHFHLQPRTKKHYAKNNSKLYFYSKISAAFRQNINNWQNSEANKTYFSRKRTSTIIHTIPNVVECLHRIGFQKKEGCKWTYTKTVHFGYIFVYMHTC